MKKFIAAFDGLNFSTSTLEYSIFLARHCNAHLVGVFLDDFTRHSYSMADISEYSGESFDTHLKVLDQKDREERDESVALFEKACSEAGITHSVHRDRNIALHELLHESIYCDLVIIEGGESLSRYEQEKPTRFVKEFLADVQCAVLVVPEKYIPFEKFTLLYDGEPSSVFSVKLFSYIFSPLKHFETEIISVKDKQDSLHLPDGRLMKEFMKRHFPDAEFVLLKGIPEDEIVRYLQQQKKNSLVVLGAYRRGRVSRLFRPSMAVVLLNHLKLPLFIAHTRA